MKLRIFPVTIVLLLTAISFAAVKIPRSTQTVLASASQPALQDIAPERVPESCPVTKPPAPAFVPPSPYPRQISPEGFWLGSNKLWTALPTDGTWKGLPHWADGTYRQKLLWYSEGYDWHRDPEPKLKLTGRRLDSAAPPLKTGEHGNGGWSEDPYYSFIVDSINVPTVGCWKITAQFIDAEVSYVIWVAE